MKSRPHIVMLASANHTAFDTRIFHKEAKSLVSSGYPVTIIVPGDQNQVVDGVEIVAVKKPANGFVKLLFSPWSIFRKAIKLDRHCIFHLHDSELLFVGLCLRLLGRKVIYDAHEDTPQQIRYQPWIPRLLKGPYSWLYRLLEKAAGATFTAIIVAEPVIARYFPARKTVLLRNFPTTHSFEAGFVPFNHRKTRLIYAGSLTRARGLDTMLAASTLLASGTGFEFFLAGSFFPPRLERLLKNHPEITYAHWLKYPDLVAALYDSKVGILVPVPFERYKTNYPVKLFEYMLAGMPVVASKYGELGRFVKEEQCGVLVEPTDAEAVAAAVQTLLNDSQLAEAMGRRGRDAVYRKYNWNQEVQHLLDLYSNF